MGIVFFTPLVENEGLLQGVDECFDAQMFGPRSPSRRRTNQTKVSVSSVHFTTHKDPRSYAQPDLHSITLVRRVMDNARAPGSDPEKRHRHSVVKSCYSSLDQAFKSNRRN